MSRVSLYSEFASRYKSGCGSEQCSTARRIVLARGTVPCDILFIGEAPGQSEDDLGQPFVGPAGHLLDRIVAKSGILDRFRVAFTNLVGCIPRRDEGVKMDRPEVDQVMACKPRLEEFIRICDGWSDEPVIRRLKNLADLGPRESLRRIVLVGKEAADWCAPGYKLSVRFHREIPTIQILHPAYIMRQPLAGQSLLEKRCVVILSKLLDEV